MKYYELTVYFKDGKNNFAVTGISADNIEMFENWYSDWRNSFKLFRKSFSIGGNGKTVGKNKVTFTRESISFYVITEQNN